MVPLNPNELSREPLDAAVRRTTSTGIWNGFDDTIDDRCAFSLRKNKLIDNIYVKSTGDVPAQLRVDRNDRCHQRPNNKRRQARGRGRRFQVAHVRLQGRALDRYTAMTRRLAQCPRRSAHLKRHKIYERNMKE